MFRHLIITRRTLPPALLAPLAAATLILACAPEAQAGQCGGENQRPCTIFERIPSCDKGLYEDFGKGKCLRPKPQPAPRKPVCGGPNQRPCKIWERVPSCDKGLVEDFAKGKCVANTDDELRKQAKAVAARSADHQRTLSGIRNCMNQPARRNRFKSTVDKRDLAASVKIVDECVSAQTASRLRTAPRGLAMAPGDGSANKCAAAYFNSLSIGIGAGGMVLAGVAGDFGIVIDLNGKRNARFYTSGEYSFGIGASVGADIIVGLSRDVLKPGVNDNLSVVAAGKYVLGGAFAVVFNYGDPFREDVFNGFAVSGGLGAGFEVGTIHKSNSRIW